MTALVVDAHCMLEGVRVYKDFSCTLNQSNIGKNANKFYIIQVLERGDGRGYYLWTRYGRVGRDGNKGVEERESASSAIQAFISRFRSKTGHDWNKKDTHKEIIPGKYAPVDIQSAEVVEDLPPTDDTLPTLVAQFIDLIAEKRMFIETLQTFKVDSKKMPLGRISNDQLSRGDEILSHIQYLCRADKKLAKKSLSLFDIDATKYIEDRIVQKSSEFWTAIPFDCGYRSAPVIGTAKDVEKCSELLDVLRNMEVAGKILRKRTSRQEIYDALHVDIQPLAHDSEEWELLSEYVQNTKGETHSFELELLEAYSLSSHHCSAMQSNCPASDPFLQVSNHKLLFHGSRTANYMGILSEGLRVPSPHQVLNGSAFGRGIYFADSVSKSFNYCHADGSGVGLVLVCEVALGETQLVSQATFDDRPPTKYDSRTALGIHRPRTEKNVKINGCEVGVPCGKLSVFGAFSLQYNEYIIYDPRNYKFRYVLKLKSRASVL